MNEGNKGKGKGNINNDNMDIATNNNGEKEIAMENTITINGVKVEIATISAKNTGDKTEVTFANVYEGWTLADFINAYGEKEVLDNIFSNMRIKLQARARNLRKAGKSDKEIIETMRNWKVGDKQDTANTMRISKSDYEEFLRFKAMQDNNGGVANVG